MEGGIFGFLDGASPWWWVALGLALAAAEMLTLTYFLLGPAAAAFVMAAILYASPGLGGTAQVAIFSLVSIAGAVAGWAGLKATGLLGGAKPATLNRRGARMVGRTARVTTAFESGIGGITIDGVAWRARLADTAAVPPAEGASVRVCEIDGATVVVEQHE